MRDYGMKWRGSSFAVDELPENSRAVGGNGWWQFERGRYRFVTLDLKGTARGRESPGTLG